MERSEGTIVIAMDRVQAFEVMKHLKRGIAMGANTLLLINSTDEEALERVYRTQDLMQLPSVDLVCVAPTAVLGLRGNFDDFVKTLEKGE